MQVIACYENIMIDGNTCSLVDFSLDCQKKVSLVYSESLTRMAAPAKWLAAAQCRPALLLGIHLHHCSWTQKAAASSPTTKNLFFSMCISLHMAVRSIAAHSKHSFIMPSLSVRDTS